MAGLRLEEAKKKVVAEVKKRYISPANVSFTLVHTEACHDRRKGVVWNEGSDVPSIDERVEAAIALPTGMKRYPPSLSTD